MPTVAEQIFSFLMIMLLGSLVGVMFDCYVSIRRFCRFRQGATTIGDVIFSLLVTAVAYAFLLLVNWGEVRVYVFVAMTLGLLFYLKAISQHTRGMLAFLFFMLQKVTRRNKQL